MQGFISRSAGSIWQKGDRLSTQMPNKRVSLSLCTEHRTRNPLALPQTVCLNGLLALADAREERLLTGPRDIGAASRDLSSFDSRPLAPEADGSALFVYRTAYISASAQ